MNLHEVPVDPVFEHASNEIFAVLAQEHLFELNALSQSEMLRLLNFVQVAEQRRYTAFAGWPEKVFLAARLACEQRVSALISKQAGGAQ
ncbi:hypothetical protein ACRCPS_31110 [Pseudomonas aeruginosa]